MGNLGKANAWIEFYDKLDNLNPDPNWSCFDLCGAQFHQYVTKSNEGVAENIEFIKDNNDWYCMMLAKYKTEIDNYLKIGSQTNGNGPEIPIDGRNATRIEWGVLGLTAVGQIWDIFWKEKFKIQNATSAVPASWKTAAKDKQINNVSKTDETQHRAGETLPQTQTVNHVWVIEQNTLAPSILWGAQTNVGLGSFPYYIDIATANRQTAENGLSNFILININKKDIDIYCQDSKIFIADWYTKVYYDKKNNMSPAKLQVEAVDNIDGPLITDTGLQYSSDESANLSLGIMPCVGKLVIFSEDNYYVYNRFGKPPVNDLSSKKQTDVVDSSFIPFVLQTDTISVFVSNGKGTINISAMEFENYGMAKPPVFGANIYGNANRDQKFGIYKIEESGTSTVIDTDVTYPRYYLFRGEKGELCTGASCEQWGNQPIDENIAQLVNVHNPPHGIVSITWEESKIDKKNKVMTIVMEPTYLEKIANGNEDNEIGKDLYLDKNFVLQSGTPFIYRLRGYYDGNPIGGNIPKLVLKSYQVMTLNHKYECQDIYAASQSVDITLYYNAELRDTKNIDIENKSYGVKIYMGWKKDGEPPIVSDPFFTGVTMDVNISEVAGKETITIHCEDYMRVLTDNYMLNSPFYDGQDWFESIQDIAARVGILNIIDDTDPSRERYFLPSGYSFQEPRYKFPPTQTTKDCITDITKMCEKVVYFDNNGGLRCDELQGGLYFSTKQLAVIPEEFKFYRDPQENDSNVILDEKKTERLTSSAVNQIIITSVDRNTGQPLQVSHVADREMPWLVNGHVSTYQKITNGVVPPYKKILFIDQNAFGNQEAAQNFVALLAERVYKVVGRISFKTATGHVIPPLQFIGVDNLRFRTTSFSRNYNAEDNSIITNISADWLGAAASQQIP